LVPEGFQFAIKASRFCTNRTLLSDGAEGVARFCAQGFTELGAKLGPILWQFMPHKRFEAEDFGQFLKLLPKERDGMPLRHALEVRHDSFKDPRFIAMAREAGAAIVCADSDDYPQIADLTGDFVYARLQRCREEVPTGYDERSLDRWSGIAHSWAQGKQPDGLDYVSQNKAPAQPRDTYVFFIAGAKVRAPAAAQALIERL
jgi:uncharacterized protein YecE (DUF72 family)